MDKETLALALADSAKTPAINGLERIGQLVQKQLELEYQVESLQNRLDEVQKELTQLQTQDLPKAMSDANCDRFDTADGFTVKVQTMYVANINKGDQLEVFDWMQESNFDGIIESNVKVAVGKGNRDAAKELMNELQASGQPAYLEESIHWATLRAFVREQVEAGKELHPKIKHHQLEKATIKRK